MKRRAFVNVSAMAGLGLMFPWYSCKENGDTLVLPIISKTGKKVVQFSENIIEIHKAEGVVKVTSNVAIKIKTMEKARIFNQVPGMEVLPLLLVFHKDVTEVNCTIAVS